MRFDPFYASVPYIRYMEGKREREKEKDRSETKTDKIKEKQIEGDTDIAWERQTE